MLENAHLVMVTESHLKNTDLSKTFNLPGFEMVRMDQTTSAHPSGGIVIYVHNSVNIQRVNNYEADGVEMITIKVEYLCSVERNIVLYKHPGISRRALLQALSTLSMPEENSIPTVLIGDFNINALLPENKKFIQSIEQITGLNLQDCDLTTKQGAQLDLVFSNKNLDCVTHFIPWSLHFGISCTVKPSSVSVVQ